MAKKYRMDKPCRIAFFEKDKDNGISLQPLYKEGFKDGCADQKAGILIYDSQGTLDEFVYGHHAMI